MSAALSIDGRRAKPARRAIRAIAASFSALARADTIAFRIEGPPTCDGFYRPVTGTVSSDYGLHPPRELDYTVD